MANWTCPRMNEIKPGAVFRLRDTEELVRVESEMKFYAPGGHGNPSYRVHAKSENGEELRHLEITELAVGC